MEIKIQAGKYVVVNGNATLAAFQTMVEAKAYLEDMETEKVEVEEESDLVEMDDYPEEGGHNED